MKLESFFENFELLTDAPNAGEKLREIILQLAPQGKLVPQNPNHEPASILFQKIDAKRKKLINEGKLKEIKLPIITQSDSPYPLPSGWEWVRLGNVVTFIGGSQPPKSKFVFEEREGYTRLIQIRDYKTDNFKTYVPNEFVNRPCNEEDVMIGRYGPPVFQILRGLTGTYNVALMKAEPIESSVTRDYLFYLLQEPRIQKVVVYESERTAGQTGVRKELLNSFIVGLPPLVEQSLIVAKVKKLTVLCDEIEKRQQQRQESIVRMNENAIAQLLSSQNPDDFRHHWQRICNNFDLLYSIPETIPKLRQAILLLAVQGKLVRQDPNDEPSSFLLDRIKAEKQASRLPLFSINSEDYPYKAPQGWDWAHFSEVATIASNLVKPELYPDFAHIAPDNIEKETGKLLPYRTVSEDEVRSANHRFYSGQILYSKIRPNLAKVVIVNFDGLCSADMYPINAHIYPEYLLKYMLSPIFLSMAVRTDTRVAMPKINQTELNKILVAVPPLAEQKRIVEKCDRLMSLCDTLEAKLKQGRDSSEKLMEVAAKQVLAS